MSLFLSLCEAYLVLSVYGGIAPTSNEAAKETRGDSANIIGYDCSDPNTQAKLISLNSVKPCVPKIQDVKETTHAVQVVQSQSYLPVRVKSCLVEETRLIVHCGMHSHVSTVGNALSSKIVVLGREGCEKAHLTRSIALGRATFLDLPRVGKTTRTYTAAGQASASGECKGGSYSDSTGSYSNVVVHATISITMDEREGIAQLGDDTIILPDNGLSCPLLAGYCADDIRGESVWSFTPSRDCHSGGVDILYDGKGIITTADDNQQILVIRSVDSTFALKIRGKTALCGRYVRSTDIGRVFVSVREIGEVSDWSNPGAVYSRNLDLSSQISSKLLFVSHMMYTNMRTLASDFYMHECDTRKMVLENRLILGGMSPDKVALLTKEVGHYGRVYGEVMYIIKCVMVKAQLRYTSRCYQEIPIRYREQDMFLSPTTRLLVPNGDEVPCSNILRPMFDIGGKWYIRSPDLVQVSAPDVLDPNQETAWTYEPLKGVEAGGLYSKSQLDALQKEMMFPSVREAVSNSIARRVNDMPSTFQAASLWGEAEVSDLAGIVAGKISWFFRIFGHYASILIGVYLLWKAGIYLLSVCANVSILRRHGGRGVTLCASVGDAFTSLWTLHKSTRASQGPKGIEGDSQSRATPPLDAQEPTEPNSPYTRVVAMIGKRDKSVPAKHSV